MPPTTYRITVAGRLTQRLGSAFEGFVLEPGREQTALVGDTATKRTFMASLTESAAWA